MTDRAKLIAEIDDLAKKINAEVNETDDHSQQTSNLNGFYIPLVLEIKTTRKERGFLGITKTTHVTTTSRQKVIEVMRHPFPVTMLTNGMFTSQINDPKRPMQVHKIEPLEVESLSDEQLEILLEKLSNIYSLAQ